MWGVQGGVGVQTKLWGPAWVRSMGLQMTQSQCGIDGGHLGCAGASQPGCSL